MPLATSKIGRNYTGVKPQVFNPLDYRFRLAVRLALPAQKDQIQWQSPVKDQGQEGCCTGFASSEMAEFSAWRYDNQKLIFSPQFIYHNELVLEGTISQGDGGAQMISGPRVMNRVGRLLESEYPYVVGGETKEPTPQQVALASTRKWGSYHRITSLYDVKTCLVSGYVCTAAITVYESFESDAVAANGVVPVPDPNNEQMLGGHAVLIVGYDDTTKMLTFRNSWGPGWGDAGYFHLPYAALPIMVGAEGHYDSLVQHNGHWGA